MRTSFEKEAPASLENAMTSFGSFPASVCPAKATKSSLQQSPDHLPDNRTTHMALDITGIFCRCTFIYRGLARLRLFSATNSFSDSYAYRKGNASTR